MAIRMIYARTIDGYISDEQGRLPWDVPADLKMFKKLTLNSFVLMGRKTYDSLPKSVCPLPNRANLVVSRSLFEDGKSPIDLDDIANDVSFFDSIESAVQYYLNCTRGMTINTDLNIIGGKEIYEATWGLCDQLYRTTVHRTKDFIPGTQEPKLDMNDWERIKYYNLGDDATCEVFVPTA